MCRWEDDNIQLQWPDYEGGANGPSLIQAQQSYMERGAKWERSLPHVRSAHPDEPIEVGWRPIDLTIDSFESSDAPPSRGPDDDTALYWWRPTFWRHQPGRT